MDRFSGSKVRSLPFALCCLSPVLWKRRLLPAALLLSASLSCGQKGDVRNTVCDPRCLCVRGSQKRRRGKKERKRLHEVSGISKLQTDMTYNHHRLLLFLPSSIISLLFTHHLTHFPSLLPHSPSLSLSLSLSPQEVLACQTISDRMYLKMVPLF